jgi:hypothetical protein
VNDKSAGKYFCPATAPKLHCHHWWDGAACCFCGSPKANEGEVRSPSDQFGGNEKL